MRSALLLGAAVAAAFALNLLIALEAVAAGWTLPEDTSHFKVNTSRQASADSRGFAQSESFGFKPYFEYGLTDRVTMGLGNETRLVKSGLENGAADRTDGVMTTELFLRGRLRDKDWYMLSLQDIVRLPGQEATPGSADSTLRLQYGRAGKIGDGTWTSSVKTGFHPGFDHAPEKFQADLALGWRPVDRWQVTARSINTIAEQDPTSKGQLSVSRSLSRSLSVQVGGWQTISGGGGEPHGYDAMVWLGY